MLDAEIRADQRVDLVHQLRTRRHSPERFVPFKGRINESSGDFAVNFLRLEFEYLAVVAGGKCCASDLADRLVGLRQLFGIEQTGHDDVPFRTIMLNLGITERERTLR